MVSGLCGWELPSHITAHGGRAKLCENKAMCASLQLVASDGVHLAGNFAVDLKHARSLNLSEVEFAWYVGVSQLARRVACLWVLYRRLI